MDVGSLSVAAEGEEQEGKEEEGEEVSVCFILFIRYVFKKIILTKKLNDNMDMRSHLRKKMNQIRIIKRFHFSSASFESRLPSSK